MKRIVFAALALVFSIGTIQAQIVSSQNSRFTVNREKIAHNYENYNRISFGLATDKLKSSDEKVFNFKDFDYDKKSVTLKGIDFNYLRGINLTQKFPLYLEVGGRLTYDTYKYEDDDEDYYGSNTWSERLNLLSLSVPVNVSYKYTLSNGFYVAPFVGIHFRLNLLANDKWKETFIDRYGDVEKDDGVYSFFKADEDDDDAFFADGEDTAKRFQFGGQIGVNLGYKAFNLGLAYYFDTPIYKNDDADFKVKTGGVSLTVGYNF